MRQPLLGVSIARALVLSILLRSGQHVDASQVHEAAIWRKREVTIQGFGRGKC
jgi:hypothetical protein